jgi:hypothetical protein
MSSKFSSVLMVLLSLLLLIFGYDFWNASRAIPCGEVSAGSSCYPWGSEGPTASSWIYQSKMHYMTGTGVFLLSVCAALGSGFAVRRNGVRIFLMIALPTLSWVFGEFLTKIFRFVSPAK